jgi:hypothetical protein
MLGGFQPLPATGPGSLLEAIHRVVLRLGNEEGAGRGRQGPVGQLGDAGMVGFWGAGGCWRSSS